MKATKLVVLLVVSAVIGGIASADTVIIDSKLAESYHFVDTYEILIDEDPPKVWPHLVDVKSWMYEFSLIHESGPRNAEGAVFRLYEDQDYFMELAKLIPEKLAVAVNLPSSVDGEQLVGIGMFTLTEVDGKTLVSTFMTRQFVQLSDTANALRERRESPEFQDDTQERWNRFMTRLKELAEDTYGGP